MQGKVQDCFATLLCSYANHSRDHGQAFVIQLSGAAIMLRQRFLCSCAALTFRGAAGDGLEDQLRAVKLQRHYALLELGLSMTGAVGSQNHTIRETRLDLLHWPRLRSLRLPQKPFFGRPLQNQTLFVFRLCHVRPTHHSSLELGQKLERLVGTGRSVNDHES